MRYNQGVCKNLFSTRHCIFWSRSGLTLPPHPSYLGIYFYFRQSMSPIYMTGSYHLHHVLLTVARSHLHQLPGMKWNEFSFIHGEHFILNLLQPYFIPLEKLFTISFSLEFISYHISLVSIYISFTTSFPHGNFIIIALFHSPRYSFRLIFHSSRPIFQ